MNENVFLNSASNSEEHSNSRSDAPERSDLELLDAYSQAVVGVVDQVTPAVISVSRVGAQGSGSGFIVTEDGYAVTNHHVIAGSKNLVSRTSDGDRIETVVAGADPANDIAVLKLAAGELPTARLGESSLLRVGQLVVAMGSPLGLQSTVSTGVVSALGRSMRGEEGQLIENVVQHSAPINPGNSGGPLVDTRGQIVGVNTAIIMMTQGLGFAVASSTVQWVLNEVMQHGKVRRRQLGIVATNVRLPKDIVVQHDLLSNQAVEVVDVQRGGNAESGGIRPGDIVVAINDRIITGIDDIHRILTLLPLEMPVSVTVLRGTQRIERTIF